MNTLSTNDPSVAARYHFIVPIWGAKFVDMFVNQSLPSQLAAGNLPSLPPGMVSYQIFTHAADAGSIWESSSVKKLRRMMDVSLTVFTDDQVKRDYASAPDPYHVNLKRMSWCYDQGIRSQRGVDTAFIFMTPDSVWANGAFRYMHQCQCSGIRALVALGLITVRPFVQPRLEGFRAGCDRNIIDISSRKLVHLACDALHPLGASRIVKDGGARFPSAYYWMKPGKGLVARCFYLHPVMVRPLVDLERLTSTVDYRYVQQACPDLDRVRIVTDSDDLFYIDMADVEHEAGELRLHNRSRTDLLKWMCQWTDDFHRAYFRQAIILRESDGDERFEREQAESATFAASLLQDYDRYHPASGQRLMLSNVFAHDVDRAAAGPQPGLRQTLLRSLSWLRRALAFLRSLPRRLVRELLRTFLRKIEGHFKRAIEIDWKPDWIRTEYELRREISLLRAAFEAKKDRIDPCLRAQRDSLEGLSGNEEAGSSKS